MTKHSSEMERFRLPDGMYALSEEQLKGIIPVQEEFYPLVKERCYYCNRYWMIPENELGTKYPPTCDQHRQKYLDTHPPLPDSNNPTPNLMRGNSTAQTHNFDPLLNPLPQAHGFLMGYLYGRNGSIDSQRLSFHNIPEYAIKPLYRAIYMTEEPNRKGEDHNRIAITKQSIVNLAYKIYSASQGGNNLPGYITVNPDLTRAFLKGFIASTREGVYKSPTKSYLEEVKNKMDEMDDIDNTARKFQAVYQLPQRYDGGKLTFNCPSTEDINNPWINLEEIQ